MHILVVNDDGPPSTKLSPYLRPLVNTLQANGHQVSVAIPAASRSWIGKAHLIEASLTASYVHPDAFNADGSWDTNFESPDPENDWVVIRNGTPASCAQLGLYNLFSERAPIDLVISGPNHGRNASTIYNLSSGTVGGALEAVFCGKRGIAISFGSKDPQADDVIAAAARLAVKVVLHLYENWDDRVELYNINVPMCLDVEERPVLYTRTLPYYWSRGCLYAEQGTEKKVNGVNGVHVNGETNGTNGTAVNGHAPAPSRQRQFKWSADLSDMKKTLQESEVGTDAHTVLNGSTSVTALRANFWHVPGLEGPLYLD
ncbi:Survival protein SurE-like phosphatase/nucleotidase [Penicillium robsamsonii]|uniref:Survival protein SurE-like phosphatase/nucleotidase n=1 Tax=Penicillium robsamsonii TaxID=1792511 RepID=UPI002548098B|nr:Survival protein SurE-like phosphatase/nucleotidase [Penicillium robsamsonii]KAJ5824119.1 Survival protein SurE-like phosphatase/nucleotidase [Penicillium robsamsonii]